jgi:hypothetical protein
LIQFVKEFTARIEHRIIVITVTSVYLGEGYSVLEVKSSIKNLTILFEDGQIFGCLDDLGLRELDHEDELLIASIISLNNKKHV